MYKVYSTNSMKPAAVFDNLEDAISNAKKRVRTHNINIKDSHGVVCWVVRTSTGDIKVRYPQNRA